MYNKGRNVGSPGFSNEEREKFTNLLEAGFTDSLKDKIIDSVIYRDIMGSDHCPVGLEIDIK